MKPSQISDNESPAVPSIRIITDKIISDGEKRAAEILDEARREARQVITDQTNAADIVLTAITAKAREEGVLIKEISSAAQRKENRDRLLAVKWALINQTLGLALEGLKSITLDGYCDYVLSQLEGADLSGDEGLLLTAGYDGAFPIISRRLALAGRPALNRYVGAEDTESGFKLMKPDMEQDFSFEAMMDYYSESLEKLVLDTLGIRDEENSLACPD